MFVLGNVRMTMTMILHFWENTSKTQMQNRCLTLIHRSYKIKGKQIHLPNNSIHIALQVSYNLKSNRTGKA